VTTIVNDSDENLLLARSVFAVPAPLAPQGPPAKKQKVEPNDLSSRHALVKSQDPRTKLEAMVNLWKDKPNWSKPLTPRAKSFFIKFLAPVMNCLERHFQGQVDALLVEHPQLQHTTFPKKCCSGTGDSCSPKS